MENTAELTKRCEEVFDYVLSLGSKRTEYEEEHNKEKESILSMENKLACPSPLLTWEHFEFLIDKHVFRAEDMSFYVFAFMLHCDAHYPYCIPKTNFVECLEILSKEHNVEEFGEQFVGAFEILRQGVIDENKRIRSGIDNSTSLVNKYYDSTLRSFYEFLYEWCLRYNKTTDRVTIAMELWSMFFQSSVDPLQSENDSNNFHGYAIFPRLTLWLEFIQQESAKQSGNDDSEQKEALLPSRDVWNQLLMFAELTSLDTYDCNGAWPLVIDNFVTWLNERSECLPLQ